MQLTTMRHVGPPPARQLLFLAAALLLVAALRCTSSPLPSAMPDSIGPFLRFSMRDGDVIKLSVLAVRGLGPGVHCGSIHALCSHAPVVYMHCMH
jgi:hypothetical protein